MMQPQTTPNSESRKPQALSSLERPASSSEVKAMFEAIAPRYDLLNSVLSGGMHKVWEKRLVESLPKWPEASCLDLCTGTGALMPRLADRYRRVLGVDISEQMLERAKQRFPHLQNVEWQAGDAQALNLQTATFDVVTVAYGVRNWPDPERGLREITRVLRPGGQVGILEFGQPRNPVWGTAFRMYSRYVIPCIGGMVSGHRSAYQYLPKTSAAFPCGAEFVALLERAGLAVSSCTSLMGGVAYIYVAQKKIDTDVKGMQP
jgi:demethylmenaquinone methyltransferase/2-methoxy-6-polyprenyl-1,4-benzoquinol methylase